VPGNPRKKRNHKPDLSNPPSVTTQPEPPDPTRLTWTQHLKRAFEFDVTVCPLCGGTLRVIFTDPAVINKILTHIRQSRATTASARFI